MNGLTSLQRDYCVVRLQSFKSRKLKEIVVDNIIRYWDKNQLIDFIKTYYTEDDWQNFYEEYIAKE